MAKRRRVYFVVSLVRPEGVTLAELRDYIEEWVACGKGSRHPEDPMFDLDGDTVRVTKLNLDKHEEEEEGGTT